MTPADLRVPSEAEPLALADLTDRERKFLLTFRSIPRHRWPVLGRMMDRMIAGMATEEAKALATREVTLADAEHAAS